MKKYAVNVHYDISCLFEVEANNEEEAEEIAVELLDKFSIEELMENVNDCYMDIWEMEEEEQI